MRSQWRLIIRRLVRKPSFVPSILSLYFLIAALIFIPHPGLQNDELYFSGPIFDPANSFYRIAIGSAKIPLMVMSYSGALKTWLYAGLFHLFKPGIWSVRLPVALMGIGTIWLTWIWVRRIAGTRAAVIAAALLATDTLFLLTDIFDWGPVALQHLLLMGGLVAIQRWLATKSRRALAFGSFLWGLGMWDKALLSWPLIGLGVACLLIYPRAMFRRVMSPAVLIALAAFWVGMLPLVVYNVQQRGETAASNAKFGTDELRSKVEVLRRTINGSVLFGYMVDDGSVPNSRAPQTWTERASVAIYSVVGSHRTNWMLAGWIAGFLCFIALWGTPSWRPLLFLLVTMLVTWAQMAITIGAGDGPHHVILFWPFPAVFLGIAFAGLGSRFPHYVSFAVTAGVAVLVLGNLLTTNEYLRDLTVNGGIGGWTDAIYPLSNSLNDNTSGHIGLVDWGYLTSLQMLHDGRLPLFIVDPNAAAAGKKQAIDLPNTLFIQHTEDKQLFIGVNDRLRNAASHRGDVECINRTIKDSNGRPVFEIFHFQPSQVALSSFTHCSANNRTLPAETVTNR